jgi:predicted AAA+ superfamily ATPase
MKPIAYRPRLQEATLERALAAHPVVVLHGARQAGKSTLVQSAACCRSRDYRTLDDFDVLETVRRDPGALWKDGGTVTLDEVQRAPDLLLAVKREADRKRTPGRFLLTGSANLLLMKGVADSLAGRAVYIEVPPMTVGELLGGGGGSNFDVLLSSKTAEEAAERLRRRSPAASPCPRSICLPASADAGSTATSRPTWRGISGTSPRSPTSRTSGASSAWPRRGTEGS